MLNQVITLTEISPRGEWPNVNLDVLKDMYFATRRFLLFHFVKPIEQCHTSSIQLDFFHQIGFVRPLDVSSREELQRMLYILAYFLVWIKYFFICCALNKELSIFLILDAKMQAFLEFAR